ncbi:MAG TPA: cytochrome c [Phenylobacterium sp.]
MIRTIATLFGIVMLSGCAASESPEPGLLRSASFERGRSIAETRCASCHAVDASPESPRADAPPFVRLRERYVAISLQRRLADMVETEHSEMPPLRLDSEEVDALAAYMEGLQER